MAREVYCSFPKWMRSSIVNNPFKSHLKHIRTFFFFFKYSNLEDILEKAFISSAQKHCLDSFFSWSFQGFVWWIPFDIQGSELLPLWPKHQQWQPAPSTLAYKSPGTFISCWAFTRHQRIARLKSSRSSKYSRLHRDFINGPSRELRILFKSLFSLP